MCAFDAYLIMPNKAKLSQLRQEVNRGKDESTGAIDPSEYSERFERWTSVCLPIEKPATFSVRMLIALYDSS